MKLNILLSIEQKTNLSVNDHQSMIIKQDHQSMMILIMPRLFALQV